MRIVMHPRNVAALRKAKASTAGSYLWSADPAVSSPTSMWGVPVFSTPQLGIAETQGSSSVTNSIYVCDIDNVIYVNRQDIVIELDRSRLFNSDQSELRAKLRGDLISPNPTRSSGDRRVALEGGNHGES
jgi:HK97 family phage major capsid protein